ncbi:MAG: hypothetical protein KUF77_09715 [Candidatus Thiodiazotropha sp. (ex Lucina aurantia)]|nr:hypothetical protein [Candidatus Thiodiazotropha taylori]MBV2097841.1 hypothetical protein [Candidatus Thiodiazotropha sp. (ex Codakia orbicularis)]MBV2103286.1 hypothetical protein [Candidatus Thiodiazotropha sp. (ex Lucina aurantia)]MBV2116351.1 hypothetical protein [Candidatus Thiodiazotropha sp. (ex Lucina aurantia)]
MTDDEIPKEQKSYLDKFYEGTLTKDDFQEIEAAILRSLDHEVDQDTLDEMEEFANALFSPDNDFNPFDDEQNKKIREFEKQLRQPSLNSDIPIQGLKIDLE